jgi:glycosyltransferase involved in cell wall biosynthesis
MKILLISDPAAAHTMKWANALNDKGFNIFLYGLSNFNKFSYSPDIKLESLYVPERIKNNSSTTFSKIIYLKAIRNLKNIIEEFKPNILHAHYASSFGLLGALTGFHPYIISVWGSDIYEFPNASRIFSTILKFNLSKADRILSTSRAMLEETKKYTDKEIILTPFGIDTNKFTGRKVNSLFDEKDLVIGTIKTLQKNYGIEYLIRAFEILVKKYPEKSLKLLIVGEGEQRKYLETLVDQLGIKNVTIFTGYIEPDKVDNYHNMLDIYVAVSLAESFGVAVLEASSCSKPVVVSNVGGLPEVVENGKTGFIIEKGNFAALAKILEKLVLNPELRKRLGNNGREKVVREYDWTDSVNKMVHIYESIMINKKNKFNDNLKKI